MAKDKKQYRKQVRFNNVLARKVCLRLANGESLNKICHDVEMPSLQSVYNWLRAYPGFLQQYIVARELQAMAFAEQIIDLADGVDCSSAINLHKVKLQIDARKWYAANILPRKFNNAMLLIDVDVDVDVDAMVQVVSEAPQVPLTLTAAQAYQQLLAEEGVSTDAQVKPAENGEAV